MNLKSMPRNRRGAVISHSGGQKMVLNIGRLKPARRANKCTGLEMISRAQPFFSQEPLSADDALADKSEFGV